MDELPSTRFRVAFPRLIEPTRVTVQGHEIGTWWPRGTGDQYQALLDEIAHLKRELAARPSLPAANTSLMGTVARGESFGAPQPAPKTRTKR